MTQRLAVAISLAAAAGVASAATVVGGATLIDTATVHAGTVAIGPVLSYISGGNGVTGTANGTSYTSGGFTVAAALAAADHVWAAYDPALLFGSSVSTNAVIAIPAIDHGWTPDNTGEFWEPFEFKVYGCSAAAGCIEEGVITDVWRLGVDDVGSMKNADDFATRWAFKGSYSVFAVISGDRLVGGPYSPGEGEIDALALPAVPEPGTYLLLAAGLGLVGWLSRGRARRA